jgi:hypothetical protein
MIPAVGCRHTTGLETAARRSENPSGNHCVFGEQNTTAAEFGEIKITSFIKAIFGFAKKTG